jgi:hypothetical protein
LHLVAYLAYGNVSMRMIYQYTNQHYENSKKKSHPQFCFKTALALPLYSKVWRRMSNGVWKR